MSVNSAELLTRAPESPSLGPGANGTKPARSRPRVVILASAMGLSNRGVGQYERYLLPHLLPLLAAGGCDVSVVLSRDAMLPSLGEGVQYLRLPAAQRNSLLRLLAEQLYIPYVSWGADCFLSLDSAFPLVPIKAKRKLGVIHDIHVILHRASREEYPEDYTWQYKAWGSRATKRIVKTADRIITVSHSVARELQSFLGVAADRILPIHHGVDHDRFRPFDDPAPVESVRKRYALPESFYLFVGPYSRKKNLRLIVEAYGAGELRPDVFLPVVVVGDTRRSSRYAATLALVEATGHADLFRFLGFVPDDDLPALYGAARALLYPSLYEGFGLPALEAMACGTPVVTSNRSSLPEVVGDAALLVDPTQPASLVRALDQLSNEGVRQDLIARGLKHAQKFSWRHTAEAMAEAILQ